MVDLWGGIASRAALVLRVTGESLGRCLRERICGPLGADVHVGLADDHGARVHEPHILVGERPRRLISALYDALI